MTGSRTGHCLCGAVHFTVHQPVTEASACHCEMCRRWSGGVFVDFDVPGDAVSWEGEDQIARYSGSDWAERGFCRTCGSHLYYRFMGPGEYHGAYSLMLGSLDDTSGIKVTKETWADECPEGLRLEGDLRRITGAECRAALAKIGANA